jgi:hypothetical protein
LYIIFPFCQFPSSFPEHRTSSKANPIICRAVLFAPGTFRKYFPNKKVAARKTPFSDTFCSKCTLTGHFFSFIITIYGKEIHTAISSTRKNRRYSLLISGAL